MSTTTRVQPNKVMRIVQCGLGIMGEYWLRTVAASPEVVHAGFVEIDQELIRRRVDQYDLDRALVFSSLDEALASVGADAVLVVTPHATHAPLSITAMRAGLPVLCEKPLADTMEAAMSILRTSQETGVLHMVAQNYRYTAQAQAIKAVLTSGDLGTLGNVRVEYFKGPVLQGFHQQLPYPLIMDMTIHHFDMMRFFLDAEPVSVLGRSWNPPWSWFNGDAAASLVIEFPAEVMVTYTGSWCCTGAETTWNGDWRFEGENGVLLLANDELFMQRRTDSIDNPKGFPQYLNEPMTLIPPAAVASERQVYLLHELYQAVMLGRRPATTVSDNIKSYRMVWDAIRSFETGLPVRVTEILA